MTQKIKYVCLALVKLLLSLVVAFVLFLLVSLICVVLAYRTYESNVPSAYSMSKWEAENMTLYVIDENTALMEVMVGDDTFVFDVFLGGIRTQELYLFSLPLYEEQSQDVIAFDASWPKKNTYIITAQEDSLYFEKGQRFQFNLVNKELDKNEIPYLHLLEENVS